VVPVINGVDLLTGGSIDPVVGYDAMTRRVTSGDERGVPRRSERLGVGVMCPAKGDALIQQQPETTLQHAIEPNQVICTELVNHDQNDQLGCILRRRLCRLDRTA
jgi:hypothetical protein